ncbi:MAG: hypothetical protein NW205_05425 [Hyphomicrobiaceae bacterium]|nr:hypothetical protein [Hyphomicrobiaceae bacterium]
MIEIVISACMIEDPAKCQDVNLTFMAETVTPHQCMMYGQFEIAKWVEGHPKWRVAKWRCGKARIYAKA